VEPNAGAGSTLPPPPAPIDAPSLETKVMPVCVSNTSRFTLTITRSLDACGGAVAAVDWADFTPGLCIPIGASSGPKKARLHRTRAGICFVRQYTEMMARSSWHSAAPGKGPSIKAAVHNSEWLAAVGAFGCSTVLGNRVHHVELQLNHIICGPMQKKGSQMI
jgi:hypothetical protein